jgi:hypothetical protein
VEETAALGPELRPQRLADRGEERGPLPGHPPGELLGRLEVDLARTDLPRLRGDRILQPLR